MAHAAQFKPGQSGNPKGRTKGSKNKLSYNVGEICEKHDCNPFEILAQIAAGTIELPDEQRKYFGVRIRMEAASELAQYLAPKLKALELSTDKDEGLTFVMNFGEQSKNTEV